jgi:Transglycosylase SLT domain
MLPTLTVLFAVAVLSPEPLTNQPPAPTVQLVDGSWNGTHPPDWIPPALRPKPKPKPIVPARSPAPSNSGMGSNVEQWRSLVAEFFPGEVDIALCVIRGESGGNPNAKNPNSSAAGLWQFLKSTWDKTSPDDFGVPIEVTGGSYDSGAPFDPVAATRAAAWLRNAEGWGQWNAYRRC